MPAKNLHHDAVVRALQADGWTITHDPLKLAFGGVNLFVDLGAERPTIAAERGSEKIAVEVQSFLNPSPVRDLQEAAGQYGVYRGILERSRSGRDLYMAITREIAETVFEQPLGQLVVEEFGISLMVFDSQAESVIAWKKWQKKS